MNHKDNENEGIGIIAIIVLAVLAVIGLYFLFSHHPPGTSAKHSILKYLGYTLQTTH